MDFGRICFYLIHRLKFSQDKTQCDFQQPIHFQDVLLTWQTFGFTLCRPRTWRNTSDVCTMRFVHGGVQFVRIRLQQSLFSCSISGEFAAVLRCPILRWQVRIDRLYLKTSPIYEHFPDTSRCCRYGCIGGRLSISDHVPLFTKYCTWVLWAEKRPIVPG